MALHCVVLEIAAVANELVRVRTERGLRERNCESETPSIYQSFSSEMKCSRFLNDVFQW